MPHVPAGSARSADLEIALRINQFSIRAAITPPPSPPSPSSRPSPLSKRRQARPPARAGDRTPAGRRARPAPAGARCAGRRAPRSRRAPTASRASTRPTALPQPRVRWSCTDGKRLFSTSSKSSTRAFSRRASQGTSGSSCVIHATHSGCVHSSSVVRRAGQRVDVAVGAAALRRGRVEVADQLHRRVHALEPADEGQRVVDLALGLVGIAEHEGELGDDAVLARLRGHARGSAPSSSPCSSSSAPRRSPTRRRRTPS